MVAYYFPTGHWYLGPDIGESDTANYESMVCPLTGYKMLSPVFVTIDGSNVNSNDKDEWTECSNKGINLIALTFFGTYFTFYPKFGGP